MSQEAARQVRADSTFHWVLLLLSVAILVLASIMSVRGGRQVLLPGTSVALPELCTTQRFWGIACPGCGMTRSFISLAHGDWRSAWSYNPAALWLFAMLAFQVPYRAIQLVRVRQGRGELSLGYVTHGALVVLAIGLVGQWAARLCGVAF